MMRGRVRAAAVTAATAVLALGGLTGCSSETQPEPEPAAAAGDAGGKPERAAEATPGSEQRGTANSVRKGATIGAPGSPCPMPVTFDVAADWKPEAVASAADEEFGALLKQGPVTLVCEIDAKPAGNIGFIRVWTGGTAGDDAREALRAFVADAAKKREKESYTDTKAGGLAAVEVTYVNTDEMLDEPKKERAFAVTTPKGVVIVDLGGFDTAEHEAMLPAYELARKSVRVG
ncbi:lipoprotein [Streptomyces sp. NPDC018833]|uniref:lipoprotein n=1 Tax=Streptomyces sp. NPDC018833 TaxID=3365053 RepID=UPI00379BC542